MSDDQRAHSPPSPARSQVWVEIYDSGTWHHLGAAEPSPLDSTWFDERLRPESGPRVFASTFRRRPDDDHACGREPGEASDDALDDAAASADSDDALGLEPLSAPLHRFPLPWRDEARDEREGVSFPAVEVTARYRARDG